MIKKILLAILIISLFVFLAVPVLAGTNSYYTSSSDGYLSCVSTVYGTTRTSTTATDTYKTAIELRVGQFYFDPHYVIHRTALYFDTSSIPDGATITAAYLKVYGYWDSSVTDFNITIQNGMPTYPHDPLVSGDYYYDNYSSDGGSLSTAGFVEGAYSSITLNSTGRSWISKTGTTKFLLRSSRDINGDTPTGLEYVSIYSYEMGSGYQPYLEVTYTATSAPSINTDDASSVAETTARLNSTIADDGGGDVEVRFGWGETTESAITDYDNYSTYEGSYNTGEHPYLDVSSLSSSTLYYFRVEGQNDVGSTLGSELSFTTTGPPQTPTNFKAFPHSTSVSLTWDASTGSSQYLVRYSVDDYPDATDVGTQVYLGSSTSTTHSSLTVGTTYYYSVWGESGGNYSASYDTAMATTSAATVGGDNLPTPDTPSRWLAAPDYTNLSNLVIMYDAVNGAADSLGMPRESMWMMLALLAAIAVGIGVYVISGHKMLIGAIAMTLVMVFGWAIKIVPFWIPLMTIILVIGLKISHREVEY